MLINRRRFIGQTTAAMAAVGGLAPLAGRAQEPSEPKKKGIVLIGLGKYSTGQLAPALRQTKRVKLVGVVTGDPAKGRRWASEFGFPEKNIYNYDTIGQMADNPEIDIAYVVTPNALHAQHVIAVAAAGKNVMCEKPMATSVGDCEAMIGACKRAGVQLAIGYRLHYEPHTMEFIRLSQTQEFGPFMEIEGANGFRMGDAATPKTVWRLDKRLAGGGPLMDMGVYTVQEVCMAKGDIPPIAVTAQFAPITRPKTFSEVEETLTWTMEFADGAKAVCESSYNNNKRYFKAKASHGWVDLGPSPYDYRGQRLITSTGERTYPSVMQQALQMDGMIEEWDSGKPARTPGEMGRRDVCIIEAIYASVRGGGMRIPVTV